MINKTELIIFLFAMIASGINIANGIQYNNLKGIDFIALGCSIKCVAEVAHPNKIK